MLLHAKPVTGVILAGGRGSRMGGKDKGLITFRGHPLWWHVWKRLAPQVQSVSLSANRHLTQYQKSGLTIITDTFPDYPGPLAGMLSALQKTTTNWVAFSACDTPFIPIDYVQRLWQQKQQLPAVWVRSNKQDHPTLALLHRDLLPVLTDYLQQGDRKVMAFFRRVGGQPVVFEDDEQAFININTPEDCLHYGYE